ncbi:MAG: hypothetical protein MHM6MM_001346 [Cercozoa sp. M6MM]
MKLLPSLLLVATAVEASYTAASGYYSNSNPNSYGKSKDTVSLESLIQSNNEIEHDLRSVAVSMDKAGHRHHNHDDDDGHGGATEYKFDDRYSRD